MDDRRLQLVVSDEVAVAAMPGGPMRGLDLSGIRSMVISVAAGRRSSASADSRRRRDGGLGLIAPAGFILKLL